MNANFEKEKKNLFKNVPLIEIILLLIVIILIVMTVMMLLKKNNNNSNISNDDKPISKYEYYRTMDAYVDDSHVVEIVYMKKNDKSKLMFNFNDDKLILTSFEDINYPSFKLLYANYQWLLADKRTNCVYYIYGEGKDMIGAPMDSDSCKFLFELEYNDESWLLYDSLNAFLNDINKPIYELKSYVEEHYKFIK